MVRQLSGMPISQPDVKSGIRIIRAKQTGNISHLTHKVSILAATYHPDFEAFCELAKQADFVPVYRQLLSDTLTPVTAFAKIAQHDFSFLFESVVGGEKVGRFSFLGTDPFFQIDARGNEITCTRQGESITKTVEDPLAELAKHLEQYQTAHLPELPRFCGGAVGYAGYDVIRYTEHLPNAPADDRQLPDLSFGFFNRMVIFDHINKTIQIVVLAPVPTQQEAASQSELKACYEQACQRVDQLCDHLQADQTDLQLTDIAPVGDVELDWQSNFTQSEFEAAVEACKEYIRAGDIFQVVLSQRLKLETKVKPLDIYRALRVVNPSPFMFLVRTPDVELIGSSPEILVRVENREVTIRPLAGTRKRGTTEEDDQALAAELLADPKERAEHVMLVDLGRNDVGRVAQFGSVKLSDLMTVERYSHVMHITSNVTGTLLEGCTALDALRAGLPAGTVSGAPKVRAMEIIDELEPHRRGPYAGAVGYLDFNGNMDTCIALRTMVCKGETIYVQAGAGLVADSVPQMEYEETLNKAKGLLRAIQVAEQQLQKFE